MQTTEKTPTAKDQISKMIGDLIIANAELVEANRVLAARVIELEGGQKEAKANGHDRPDIH